MSNYLTSINRLQSSRLRMSTKKFKKFNVIGVNHNPQLDGVNCGVHVIEVEINILIEFLICLAEVMHT